LYIQVAEIYRYTEVEKFLNIKEFGKLHISNPIFGMMLSFNKIDISFTVINYTLSESIKSAQIVFYNTLGQVIKVLEIQDRGEEKLNVYAEDLRSGMYTYSLVVDGNVCESKKMIKE
jgi:hypothetical protein